MSDTDSPAETPTFETDSVQADRARYARAIQALLARQPGLDVAKAGVDDLVIEGGRAAGVVTDRGDRIPARAVVIASGTFLGGRLFRGEQVEDGGRRGERANRTDMRALEAWLGERGLGDAFAKVLI